MTSESSDKSLLLKNYKNGAEQYRKRILKAKDDLNNSTKLDSLILSTNNSKDQKEKLIYNEDIAYSSFEKLEQAKRTAIEMEKVGIDIGKDIHLQNEKLSDIRGKFGEMNKEISSSNSLLSRMVNRTRRNKVVLFIFGIGLIFTFLVIVYFKLFSPNDNDNNTKHNLRL
jgi:predicted RND superfamily exporter protein